MHWPALINAGEGWSAFLGCFKLRSVRRWGKSRLQLKGQISQKSIAAIASASRDRGALPSSPGQGRGQPQCRPRLGCCWLSALRAGICRWPGSHPSTHFPRRLPGTQPSLQPPGTQSWKPPNPPAARCPPPRATTSRKAGGRRGDAAAACPHPSPAPESTGRHGPSSQNQLFSHFFPRERFSPKLRFSPRTFLPEESGVSAGFIARHRLPCARLAASVHRPGSRRAPPGPPKGEGARHALVRRTARPPALGAGDSFSEEGGRKQGRRKSPRYW